MRPGPALPGVVKPVHDGVGTEAELGHDLEIQSLRPGGSQFLPHFGPKRGIGNFRMPFRISGDANPLDAVVGRQSALDECQCGIEFAAGRMQVAADDEYSGDVRLLVGAREVPHHFRPCREVPRGDVENRLEPV